MRWPPSCAYGGWGSRGMSHYYTHTHSRHILRSSTASPRVSACCRLSPYELQHPLQYYYYYYYDYNSCLCCCCIYTMQCNDAVAPTVTLQQQLIGAPLGSVVSLDCTIESSPTALHFWSRGGDDAMVLHEVSKYLMQSNSPATTTLAAASSTAPWPSFRTQVRLSTSAAVCKAQLYFYLNIISSSN